MSLLSLNGEAIRDGVITMPLVGAWHFTGRLDADAVPAVGSTASIVVANGATLTGTVRRAGVGLEIAEVQIVGGAGGMSNDVEPRHYDAPTVRIVVVDILAAAGETLSPTSDTSVLAGSLSKWSRVASSCGAALDAILGAVGATWRVLDDGTIFVGSIDWATLELSDDAELVEDCDGDARRTYADELFAARPGKTIAGIRTALVTHTVTPEATRSELWTLREISRETADPVRAAFMGAVRRVMRGIDYHALYPARVVSQSGADLSIDVQPDSSVLPPLSKVPIRRFAPQVEIRLAPGSRVLVGFENGDPQHPYASLWEAGGSLTSISIAGSSDAAALAALVLSELNAHRTWDLAHVHTSASPGSPTSSPTVAPPAHSSVASTKLLLGG